MTAVQSPNKSSSGGSAVMVALVGIALFFAFAFGAAKLLGSKDKVDIDSDGFEASAVTLDNVVLDQMPGNLTITRADNDSAVGQVAPTLIGQNFAGEEVAITHDGRAKAIYFVAHWCPHCQVEVPEIVQMLDDGLKPDDLDVYLISSGVRSGSVNYPPSAWLDAADWPTPIIRDDNTSSALISFGVGGFPYSVYLNSDHVVVGRAAGELQDIQILELWNRAVAEPVDGEIPEGVSDESDPDASGADEAPEEGEG